MASLADSLFRRCSRYEPDRLVVPLDKRGVADCCTCGRQYAERACPIFRRRFLRALGPVNILIIPFRK